MQEAIKILSMSEPFLNSSDPLLVAAFIAQQELKDDKLALKLAIKAAEKADASPLTLSFTGNLIKGQSGCIAALAFLRSRLDNIPEEYHQGIIRRIEKMQEDEKCRERI